MERKTFRNEAPSYFSICSPHRLCIFVEFTNYYTFNILFNMKRVTVIYYSFLLRALLKIIVLSYRFYILIFPFYCWNLNLSIGKLTRYWLRRDNSSPLDDDGPTREWSSRVEGRQGSVETSDFSLPPKSGHFLTPQSFRPSNLVSGKGVWESLHLTIDKGKKRFYVKGLWRH